MQDPTPRDLALADRANLFGASDFATGATPRQIARQQRLAFEQARQLQPAVASAMAEREAAARAAQQRRYFQPFAGAVILDVTTGEPWWSERGGFYVEGLYFGSIGAAERARCNAIERAHRAALREEEYRGRLVAQR
jgi:hypothetical protein